jgi:alpha-L-fucosidase
MGNSWSYVPHDHYKSATELVRLLIKIVSRGGNLLLNIGPSPDGDWDDTAYARLKEIGAWLAVNGEGIYGSHPVRPYSSGGSPISGASGTASNIYLTQSKDSLNIYAFYLGENQDPAHPGIMLPAELTIDRFTPAAGSKVTILGIKAKLKWREEGKKMLILIPTALQNKIAGQHAVTFKIG